MQDDVRRSWVHVGRNVIDFCMKVFIAAAVYINPVSFTCIQNVISSCGGKESPD